MLNIKTLKAAKALLNVESPLGLYTNTYKKETWVGNSTIAIFKEKLRQGFYSAGTETVDWKRKKRSFMKRTPTPDKFCWVGFTETLVDGFLYATSEETGTVDVVNNTCDFDVQEYEKDYSSLMVNSSIWCKWSELLTLIEGIYELSDEGTIMITDPSELEERIAFAQAEAA